MAGNSKITPNFALLLTQLTPLSNKRSPLAFSASSLSSPSSQAISSSSSSSLSSLSSPSLTSPAPSSTSSAATSLDLDSSATRGKGVTPRHMESLDGHRRGKKKKK